jgi:hypothetical protein
MAVGLACRVDRDDVGVIQGGRELRFTEEPLAEALVLGELGDEELEGDVPVKANVFGPVDSTHPAPSEQLLQPEAGDLAPGKRI